MPKKAKKTNKPIDLVSDKGMVAALNMTFGEFEDAGDIQRAMVRSALIGRAVSIRTLALREKQFKRDTGKK